jgi:hypothetical protein
LGRKNADCGRNLCAVGFHAFSRGIKGVSSRPPALAKDADLNLSAFRGNGIWHDGQRCLRNRANFYRALRHLAAQQKLLPLRVPLAEARPDQDLVKLSTERKHLTNVLKLVAYQIESDLVLLLRPHYARAEDEGRTLIQTVLQSTATLEPTDQELRVTLSPLSSPHRSQAVAALCEDLNTTETRFPGTDLRMRFAVAGYPH